MADFDVEVLLDPVMDVDPVEECSEQLDEACLRELKLMQEYTNLTFTLEGLMKAGFVQIARARYNMGSNAVGKSSLPNEDSEKDYKASVRVESTEMGSQGKFRELHRNTEDVTKNSETKQFGILTSPILKTAQASFRSVLQVSIERLNTIESIKEVRSKIETLLATKEDLLKQDPTSSE